MRLLIFFICLVVGCTPEKSDNRQVVIGLGEDIAMINPLLSRTAYSRQVEELIYLPLFQFDPNDLKLKPVLAAREPIVESLDEDRIKYTFYIRPEAKWSDGKNVTASDYAFTFKLIYNQALNTAGYRAYLSFLDQIILEKSDEKKIVVTTSRRYHLAATVLSNIEIFPQHIHDPRGVLDAYSINSLRLINSPDSSLIRLATNFEQYGRTGAESLVGSGPFELEHWESGESILLKRKSNYWGQKVEYPPVQLQAQAEYLKFNVIRDRVIAFQELKGEGIDIMNQVPLLNLNSVLNNEVPNLKGLTPDQFTYYYIALNPENPGFENSELRKAVNQCFDIQEWIEHQMFGLARAVSNPISPLKEYYDRSLPVIVYNPQRAINVFEKNGFNQIDEYGIRFRKNGDVLQKLSFDLNYSVSNEAAGNLAIFFKEKAKKCGVEINPKPQDFPSLRKDYAQGNYDMVFLASSVPPADYDPQQMWHTNSWGKGNRVRFGDQNSDKIIDKICSSLDEEKRADYYREFQQAIYANKPFLFLYSPKQRVVSKKGLNALESKLWPGYITQLLQ